MTVIDLASLDPPDLVEVLDFEAAFQMKLEYFKSIYPDWTAALKSDPVVKLIELAAYDEIRARARINDAARAVMLAFSTGADLEHLAVLLDTERAVIDPGDPAASPPVERRMESDDRLKLRAQMSMERATVAGPFGAYRAFAMDASADVRDVAVDRPEPGTVRLTIMSARGDGVPDQALLDLVRAKVSPETVRPLNDTVLVEPAVKIEYAIDAVIYVGSGPDPNIVLDARQKALDGVVAKSRRLRAGMPRSAIEGALHAPDSGVTRIELRGPTTDVVCGPREFAHCTAINLEVRTDDA
ncbi:baseplate J/gp47 family protein [Burkholderia multivorans]|uniref:baseplate assembly protein n=1 Tax=Burkholderia multivorans TaxID=87883 RepID=UPI00075856A0|nr:baseplate J/gp47 family protein [Burkholderia multivorans]KWH19582.1 baseplate J protein [Burkholderia multivorans]MBJ9616300.1 baseplate J/gp47 family protein [Burkholderia multivorans]MBR8018418.1 baseplate J/gp47 family protein [Burkholderia multivorans]MBU9330121.1 baseplate J/gp47 family protein [Burkholderia multivorans]MBU9395235.1 baseplate J/gp47 family protein [Burkholderia multivorans]